MAFLLMMLSGGDSRKLEKSREVLKNCFFGLVVSISSYLIISTAIVIFVHTVGLPNTVKFWDDSVFEGEFGIYSLLDDEEYALLGEVLVFEGDSPVICNDSLSVFATARGWAWQPNLYSTSLGGCIRH